MKKIEFASTEYGDLTGKTVDYNVLVNGNKPPLTSLKGAPKQVNNDFFCNSNNLQSLEYAPEYVDGHFNCRNNLLTSFKHAPKYIRRHFIADTNMVDDPIGDIIKYRIKAERYYVTIDDEVKQFSFEVIKDKYDEYEKMKSVTSKGFRTLLGLDK